MSRSKRALAQKQKKLATSSKYGYYVRQLSDSVKLLQLEAERLDDIDDLSSADITNELMLSRLLLADWLKKHSDSENLPLKDLVDVTHSISKIAKLAKEINSADKAALKESFLRAIITAVSHAFHKANLERTPESRAVVFANEISAIFAGRVDEERPTALPAGEASAPSVMDGEAQTLQ